MQTVNGFMCGIFIGPYTFVGNSYTVPWVRGGVPAENGFGAFRARKNASDDNEFGIGKGL